MYAKKLIPIISFLLGFCPSVFSQAPGWAWAKMVSGDMYESGLSVAADVNSNIVATGFFMSPFVIFGSVLFINEGGKDVFISKYDPSGNVIWAKQLAGGSDEEGQDVAIDNNGNVLLTGYFKEDTIIFGSDTLIGNGFRSMFIVKFNPLGNVLWTKSIPGADGHSIAADNMGNILVAGNFGTSSVTFGSDTLINSTFGYDICLVKYDSAGNVLWAKSAGGTDYDYVTGVTADAAGNIFITGYYTSTLINFDSISFGNAGHYDVYLAKYDGAGNLMWVKNAGGSSYDSATGVATDLNGNVIITGGFSSPAITFGANTLTNAAGPGGASFLVKYDSTGNVIWAESPGGPLSVMYANGIYSDNSGNSMISGIFLASTVTLGPSTLISNGSGDLFVAKFDSSGNALWGQSAGNSGWENSYAVTSDPNGDVFVTGEFDSGTILFGSSALVNSNPGFPDMFLAKLDNNTGEINLAGKKSDIIISPNPSSGNFIILYPASPNKKKLELIGADGRVIMKSVLQANTSQQKINIEDLAKGIYFVKSDDEKGFSVVKKIAVE